MNRFSLILRAAALILVVLMCASCATVTSLRFEDSHQLFLERTMENLDVSAAVAGKIPPQKTVCFVSMESEETVDLPLVAMVEDVIVRQLVGAGYSVLERDDDLLRRMIREDGDDKFQYTFFPRNIVIAGTSASAYGNRWDYGGQGYFGSTVIGGAGRDSLLVVPTNLDAADYIIAYRILECGLVYRNSDRAGLKKREAQIRLHVRVHDSRTGMIVLATNVESRAEDEIKSDSAGWLANYHYRFFSADFPRQLGNSHGYREIGGAGKEKTSTPANSPL